MIKEKIDRQLVGQTSSTLFMSIKDGYINKKVTFDAQDGLEEKIDLCPNVSKLTTQDDDPVKPFAPMIYQGKRRGQTRKIYDICNYGQRNYQNIDQIV